MRLIVGRILSAFLTAGGWLLAGVRLVLDLIGYSTIPEDAAVAKGRLDQAFDLILSTPWWVIWGFAFVSTLWLIWVSWPRARPQSSISTEAGPQKDLPNAPLAKIGEGLYVAQMKVSVTKENLLQIAVIAFNASGYHIDVDRIFGAIRCGPYKAKPEASVLLPPARLALEKNKNQDVGNFQEFSFWIEQRIPEEILASIAASTIDSPIALELSGLDVLVRNKNNPADVKRLAIWDALLLFKEEKIIHTGRIHRATFKA